MKLDEQILLEFRMELEELITEREGMIAENQDRISKGQQIAFDDPYFESVREKIEGLKNRLIALGKK